MYMLIYTNVTLTKERGMKKIVLLVVLVNIAVVAALLSRHDFDINSLRIRYEVMSGTIVEKEARLEASPRKDFMSYNLIVELENGSRSEATVGKEFYDMVVVGERVHARVRLDLGRTEIVRITTEKQFRELQEK